MANYSDERLDQIWDKGQTIKGKIPICIEKTNTETKYIVTLMEKQAQWAGMLTIPNPKHLVVLTI